MWATILCYLKIYSDVITAFATTFLAAITLMLAIIARRQYLTTQAQLRAYLGIDEEDTSKNRPPRRGEREFEFHPIITNHGQTPAYDVHCDWRVDCLPYPLSKEFKFPTTPKDNPSIWSAYPKAGQTNVLRCNPEREFSKSELAEIYAPKGGNRRLYIYGTIYYEDIFRKPRKTNFCFQILWRNGKTKNPGWYVNDTHNDAT